MPTGPLQRKLVFGLANTHAPLALMLQGSLVIDSTDFRSVGNENAASIIQSVGVDCPTCRTEDRALPETAKSVSAKPLI